MADKEPKLIDRLRQRIADLIRPQAQDTRPEPDDPQADTLSTSISSAITEMEKVFKVERQRLQRLKDYEEMDQGDVSALLDAAVDAAIISDDGEQTGFRVAIRRGNTSGVKYENIVKQMLHDTELNNQIREYMRKTLKRGDTFIEIIFDEEMNVRRLKSVPPSAMRVNTDRHGDLKQGTDRVLVNGQYREIPAAYHQVDDMDRIVAAWFPWEMIHIKWDKDDELTYSNGSFIEHMRRDWKRQKAVEDSLATARIERSYLREIHYVDVTNKTQADADEAIQKYHRNLTQEYISDERKAEWPRQVHTNLVIGRRSRTYGDRLYDDRTAVEVIDPRNTGLENIADIRYLQQKLFRRVPAETVGAGDVVGNDLTMQDVQFARLVQYAQQIMEEQLIKPLCLTQLRLKGFLPIPSDLAVKWPSELVRGSWRFSDAKFRQSMADVNYAEWGVVSRQRIAQDVYKLSDEEWEREVKRIQAEQGQLPNPNAQSAVQSRRQGNQSAGLDLSRNGDYVAERRGGER